MNRDQRLWARSAAYQKGYRHGLQDARQPPAAVIRIHMEDGRVLLTDDVIRELRLYGFDIVPFRKEAERLRGETEKDGPV